MKPRKLVLITLATIFGCGGLSKDQGIVDKIIGQWKDGQQEVTVYSVESTPTYSCWVRRIHGTRLVVKDKGVTRSMYDQGSGVLGDDPEDSVTVTRNGVTKTYNTKFFVNEKGQRVHYKSDVGKELKRQVRLKFDEFDRMYQLTKIKWKKNLKKSL